MKVATAKVLLPVLGKPMVQWVLSAARGAGVEDCCLIVGKDWQQVEQCVGGEAEYALQMERKGTGHAVMQADDFLRRHAGGHCVVLAGYDREHYICCDPWKDRGVAAWPRETVWQRHRELGMQAVALEGPV